MLVITYFLFRMVLFPVWLTLWFSDMLYFGACKAMAQPEPSSITLSVFTGLRDYVYTPGFTAVNTFLDLTSIGDLVNAAVSSTLSTVRGSEGLSNALGLPFHSESSWLGSTTEQPFFPVSAPYSHFPARCETHLETLYEKFLSAQLVVFPVTMGLIFLLSAMWFGKITNGWKKEYAKWLSAKGFTKSKRKMA